MEYSLQEVTKLKEDLNAYANQFGYSGLVELYKKEDIKEIIEELVTTFVSTDKENKAISVLITFDNKVIGIFKKHKADIYGSKIEELKKQLTNTSLNMEQTIEMIKTTDSEIVNDIYFELKMSDTLSFTSNTSVPVPDISTEDKEILSKYLTNVDKDIYCFKNLPEEVVAVILSYVSRSPNSFKANLLKLLKDEELNMSTLDTEAIIERLNDYNDYLCKDNGGFPTPVGEVNEIFTLIEQLKNTHNQDFSKSAAKAAKFHEKWILGYGHNSVAELAGIKTGFDRISILATKELEDNRLGSYIEKSTRYQQFDRSSYYIPDLHPDYIAPYCDLMDYLFEIYNLLFEPVERELKELYPMKEGQKEKPYLNSIHAKACDILRYLLPTSTFTSMGTSFNARTMASTISKMLSNPLTECQEIAIDLKTEALKICPTLIKYAQFNSYRHEEGLKSRKLANSLNLVKEHSEFLSELKPSTVEMKASISYQELLTKLTAYLSYQVGNSSFSECMDKSYAQTQNYKIGSILEAIEHRDNHDALYRAFETISVDLNIVSDYGAYRDLQRHRMMTQFKQILTPYLGFDVHPDLLKLSDSVINSYYQALFNAGSFYHSLRNSIEQETLQYCIPMAFNIQYSYHVNLRQLIGLVELRHTEQGHYSYRKLSFDIYNLLVDKYPILKDVIRFTCKLETPGLERLNSENKNHK